MDNLKNKKLAIIVESPSKCKHISEYLKAAGYKHITVIASIGHISNLKDTRKSYKNTGVFPDDNFRLNIAITEDKHDTVQQLQKVVSNSDYIFIMTDGDREGEAIAWSLLKFLTIKAGTYFRAITHEITPKAVVHAIENPVEINENLIAAAHARMALDKLIGYSLSPLAKTYIGAKSVGRCQSVGLKLVVDREKEIQNFIPEKFFDLYLNFEKNGQQYKAKYIGTDSKKIEKLTSESEVNVIKYKCKDTNNFIVKSINKKEKQDSPKPPFCTATFQQEAANKLGLKVKDAMSIAQKLYEGGFINYHRTDDLSFSPEFLAELQEYVKSTFGEFVPPRLAKNQTNAQCGHECIRVIHPELTPQEFKQKCISSLMVKVYELIWKRTIASVLPNAIISETSYNIYNDDQKFVLVANEVIFEGYRKIYTNDETAENIKDTFVVDEVLKNCRLEDTEKQTSAPQRYTEASLVAQLQKSGCGRPSTYAAIVDAVTSAVRGYSTIENKRIVPTERGLQLANFLDRAFSNIINLNYTREMEEQLDLIATGQKTQLEFLTEFFNTLETTIINNKEICQECRTVKYCPICGATMVIRRSRYGRLFWGCSNYPQCRGVENA